MLLKLSLRNIRRSVKDYAIYFVTIMFGVAMFYAFNSIGSQQILFDIEAEDCATYFEETQYILSMFSVVIAAVLGFLVIYANNFLIKRRKHEFGTYLLLGMSPLAVSRIVLYETIVVGVLSLAVGLLVGIGLSQALSFASAALFELTMTNYQFLFSSEAFVLTLLCFAAIYVVVAVFNLITVNRYKLIDLLSAHSKNEKALTRNPWICLVAFIVSIIILAIAYWNLKESKFVMMDDPRFMQATILMLIGSLIFFWSLAGFAIAVLQRIPAVYLRGLASFTVRQIASKVNTAFVSLWVVCVMLFFAITTFSVGMGLLDAFTGNIDEAAPYDATIVSYMYNDFAEDELNQPDSETHAQAKRTERVRAHAPQSYELAKRYDWNMEAALRDRIPSWDDLIKTSVQLDCYDIPSTVGVLVQQLDEGSNNTLVESNMTRPLEVIGVSQVNALRAMRNEEPIQLHEDQAAVLSNISGMEEFAQALVASDATLGVQGTQLSFVSEIVKMQIANSAMADSVLYFVVPDTSIDALKAAEATPSWANLNVTYTRDVSAESDQLFYDAIDQANASLSAEQGAGYWPLTSYFTHYEAVQQSGGLRMMITYLALYIGFIFLIATAAILAIQQLSETADSQARYRLLSKLGCDSRALSGSLFVQVLIYFIVPLLLAVCHSAWAIHVLGINLLNALGSSMFQPIAMAALFTLAIYGVYFLVTYFASRSLVRQAIKG